MLVFMMEWKIVTKEKKEPPSGYPVTQFSTRDLYWALQENKAELVSGRSGRSTWRTVFRWGFEINIAKFLTILNWPRDQHNIVHYYIQAQTGYVKIS